MRHLAPSWSADLGEDLAVHVIVTDRRHGDLAVAVPPEALEQRRRDVVDAPWTWLHQVHGNHVVIVREPGGGAGTEADASCTREIDAPLAVQVADCAPVCLAGAGGVVGVVHAGWRGLLAGVLGATVSVMSGLGAGAIQAVLGPCIEPAAYEFGRDDLAVMVGRFGSGVRSETGWGTPALDVPAAVAAALDELGVPLVARIGGCTASEADMRWSHRARGERERQAMVAWLARR